MYFCAWCISSVLADALRKIKCMFVGIQHPLWETLSSACHLGWVQHQRCFTGKYNIFLLVYPGGFQSLQSRCLHLGKICRKSTTERSNSFWKELELLSWSWIPRTENERYQAEKSLARGTRLPQQTRRFKDFLEWRCANNAALLQLLKLATWECYCTKSRPREQRTLIVTQQSRELKQQSFSP